MSVPVRSRTRLLISGGLGREKSKKSWELQTHVLGPPSTVHRPPLCFGMLVCDEDNPTAHDGAVPSSSMCTAIVERR